MPEPSNSQRALTGTMSSKDQAQHQAVQDSRLASNRIVTDDEVRSARRFLERSAKDMGTAKGACVRASHMIKVTKALMMKAHNELSAAKAEVLALCSDKYMEALEEDAKTAARLEELRSLREAAAMDCELWRTEQASLRGLK